MPGPNAISPGLPPAAATTSHAISETELNPANGNPSVPLVVSTDAPVPETEIGRRTDRVGGTLFDALLRGPGKAGLLTIRPEAQALYPGTVGLDQVMAKMLSTEDGKLAAKKILTHLEQRFQLQVPAPLVQAIAANPARLSQALQATPRGLSDGLKGLQAAIKAGKVPDIKPRTYQVPAAGLDLAQWDGLAIQRPQTELKPLAGVLHMGSVKSDLPDDRAKANIIVAETLDQLAQNTSARAGDPFKVKFNGQEYTTVQSFMDAVIASGHTIEATVEHRAADFADLKAKIGDQVLDVAASIYVKTNLGRGRPEVKIPTIHSEVIFRIRSNEQTQGQRIDADVKFYQGVSATGFHPVGLNREAAWCGRKESARLNQEQALDAIKLSAVFTDVIKSAAKKAGMGVEGYGLTGVCNDSVAIIQYAATGRTTCHPLLMLDETLQPELQARIALGGPLVEAYRRLSTAIEQVPNDLQWVPDVFARGKGSFAWTMRTAPTVEIYRAAQVFGLH